MVPSAFATAASASRSFPTDPTTEVAATLSLDQVAAATDHRAGTPYPDHTGQAAARQVVAIEGDGPSPSVRASKIFTETSLNRTTRWMSVGKKIVRNTWASTQFYPMVICGQLSERAEQQHTQIN